MLNTILKLLLATVLFSAEAYSQDPSIQWQKCYGGPQDESDANMIQTNDGGYIILGSSASNSGDLTFNYGLSDLWLLKIDISGNILWQKSLGGNSSDAATKIFQTFDGGFIVCASTDSHNSGLVGANHGMTDTWVIKLTSIGEISWQKVFGGTLNDYASDIHQTPDSGYIVVVNSESADGDILDPKGSADAWLLKLNATGDISWQKSIGGSNRDALNSVVPTPDGGFICTGSTSSDDGDVTVNPLGIDRITWIVKLNSTATIEWQKAYGSLVGNESGNEITPTNDGGYILAAYCQQNSGDITGNHGGSDGWIIKLDASGNLSWQKALGGSSEDWIGNVIASGDGGYFCIGGTYSSDGDVTVNQGAKDVWLVKLSSAGSIIWQKTFGGADFDYADAGSITRTPDGGLLIAGSTTSNNTGDVGANHSNTGLGDIWALKLLFDPLPVVLKNFSAIPTGTDVLCKWEMLQQQNIRHYIVERSEDAFHFIQLAIIAAKANLASPAAYNFTDEDAFANGNENLYYRLKMEDVDGNYKYSRTVKAGTTYTSAISIYPNPVVNVLTLHITATVSEQTLITITDNSGKKNYQKNQLVKKGKNIISINTSSLPAGAYFICLKGKNNYSQKFVKTVN